MTNNPGKIIRFPNSEIKKQNKLKWTPSFTGADLIPCDVQAIPFLRNGGVYFEIKENCFMFEGKIFEALYVCNTTEGDVLRDIKYNDDDRYLVTEDYENVTHYRREDKRIGLFRVVYCDYDFHAKEYDFGILVDGKCGFYNPVQEKFTLLPQFDFVCW